MSTSPTRYFAKAISANPTKDNGATILNAGAANVAGGYGVHAVTNNLTVMQTAFNPGQYSSIVPSHTATSNTNKSVSGGTFATMVKGQYVLRAMNATSSLAGVANSVLNSPSSDYGRESIHYQKVQRYANLHTFSWTANRDNSPTYTATYDTGTTAEQTDNAAHPTRALPGQLVYRNGSPLPIQDTYKPKTD